MGPEFYRYAVGVIAVLSILAFPAFAWAGGPGVWTKFATVDNPSDTAGMLRTADGKLHLVWLAKRASNNTLSYKTSTISLAGKLVSTGTGLSNWQSLEPDPQLVSDGSGIRLVFEGSMGTSGCFFNAVVFTATSPDGKSWTLVTGSMDQHTAGVWQSASYRRVGRHDAGGGFRQRCNVPRCRGSQLPGFEPRRHEPAGFR